MTTEKDGLVPVEHTSQIEIVESYPHYRRSQLATGIFHMSMGGFHRSHQARYIHDYLQLHRDASWGIHSVGLMDSDKVAVEALAQQKYLYTLVERSHDKDIVKVIGSLMSVTHAPSKRQVAIEWGAADRIKIITLTITEKGYCYDSDRNLDFSHPMIDHDLEPGELPISAIGYLFWICKRRMEEKGEAVTILSCDNLPGNGDITKRILLQFAEAKDVEVSRWITNNVYFPNSMVDRITPAVTEETKDLVATISGIDDKYPVISESFSQWIIEDNFMNGRPALEEVGVQFVESVEPYEKMKVCLLNGSHSALSYISYLLGYRDVDKAMADENVQEFVKGYMNNITPTVPAVEGIDVEEYKATLIERFSNPAIGDKIVRLAMDGSEKIRNAMIPPLEICVKRKYDYTWIVFALAGWFRFLCSVDEDGQPIEIEDPRAKDMTSKINLDHLRVDELIQLTDVFGEELHKNQDIVNKLNETLLLISSMSMKEALKKMLAENP